jgi:hypothetical protein
VGDLTLWDLQDLNEYWAAHPPVHLMVAAYLGVKPTGPKEKATPDRLRALAQEFGLKEG